MNETNGKRRKSSEERNAERRAELEPLAPGERPTAVTVASIVAGVLAISNLIAYFALGENDLEQGNALTQLIVVSFVLGAASIGMWLVRYWAVLGFQTLLALQILVSGLSLLRASSLRVTLVWLALMIGGGTLFWFLIRAMARIQMPRLEPSAALVAAREEAAARRKASESAAEGEGEDD